MSATFKDVHVAARMRDYMRKIATDTVNKLVPPDEFGVVQVVDDVSRHASVLMTGATLPVSIAYGFGIAPVAGDTVRVVGRSGSRYIAGLGADSSTTITVPTDISGLTVAATPLTGGEQLEILQAGGIFSTTTEDIARLAVISPAITHYTICTSTTRPAFPVEGDCIYETDTGNTLYFQDPIIGWTPPWNTSWGYINSLFNGINQGSITTEVDVLANGAVPAALTYTSYLNRVYEFRIRALVSNNTNDGDCVIRLCTDTNVELDHAVLRVPNAGDFETLNWTYIEAGIGNPAVTRKLRATCATGVMGIQNATTFLSFSVHDIGRLGAPH